jgi:hypothetical protein
MALKKRDREEATSQVRKEMTNDQILRWLIEFGSDWVHQDILLGTWADRDLTWIAQRRFGLLEIVEKNLSDEWWLVRLSQKALDRLKDNAEGEI